MAKLLKSSIFFLFAASLLIAEATHHDDNSDEDSEGSVGKINLKLKIPKFRNNGGNSGSGSGSGSGGGGNSGSGSGGGSNSGCGGEGCKCNDAKFKEFMKKAGVLYRAYVSKELAPELKSVLSKLTDFTMNYLAKEKPNEVNKVHHFLQSSAKITSGVVAQAGDSGH